MASIASLFVTRLYQDQLKDIDTAELKRYCQSIAADDEAGHLWCEENDFAGYTSYSSLNDLPWRYPIFKELEAELDKHVAAFAKDLDFDLGDRPLVLDSIWINVLPEGGYHSSHLHPHSVISGTTYIAIPEGASAIKFEDPRHGLMMAAPTRAEGARQELKNYVSVQPKAGDVLLWESWLRHEVPMNMAEEERISVSFNYGWG